MNLRIFITILSFLLSACAPVLYEKIQNRRAGTFNLVFGSRGCNFFPNKRNECIELENYDKDKMSPEAIKEFIRLYNRRYNTTFNVMTHVKFESETYFSFFSVGGLYSFDRLSGILLEIAREPESAIGREKIIEK